MNASRVGIETFEKLSLNHRKSQGCGAQSRDRVASNEYLKNQLDSCRSYYDQRCGSQNGRCRGSPSGGSGGSPNRGSCGSPSGGSCGSPNRGSCGSPNRGSCGSPNGSSRDVRHRRIGTAKQKVADVKGGILNRTSRDFMHRRLETRKKAMGDVDSRGSDQTWRGQRFNSSQNRRCCKQPMPRCSSLGSSSPSPCSSSSMATPSSSNSSLSSPPHSGSSSGSGSASSSTRNSLSKQSSSSQISSSSAVSLKNIKSRFYWEKFSSNEEKCLVEETEEYAFVCASDSTFTRPTIDAAPYKTPIQNMYQDLSQFQDSPEDSSSHLHLSLGNIHV